MLKEDVEMKIRQYILFVFIYVSVFYNLMTFLVDVIHFSQNTIGSLNIIGIYCLFCAEDTIHFFLQRRKILRQVRFVMRLLVCLNNISDEQLLHAIFKTLTNQISVDSDTIQAFISHVRLFSIANIQREH